MRFLSNLVNIACVPMEMFSYLIKYASCGILVMTVCLITLESLKALHYGYTCLEVEILGLDNRRKRPIRSESG